MSSGPPWSGPGGSYPQWPHQSLGDCRPPQYGAHPQTLGPPNQPNVIPVVVTPQQGWSHPPPPSYRPLRPPLGLPEAPGPSPRFLRPPGPPPGGPHIPSSMCQTPIGPPPGNYRLPQHAPPTSYHGGGPQLPPGPIAEVLGIPTAPPPPVHPYPSPGPTPPPTQHFNGPPGSYGWGEPPPTLVPFSQAPPPTLTPDSASGPTVEQVWPDWNKHRPPVDDLPRHSSRPNQDRSRGSSSGSYRDDRPRDHELGPRHQERSSHSSRYDGERGSIESRYKDGYSSKYSENLWSEKRENRRKRSRSPPDFSKRMKPRQYSPPPKITKESHNRYDRERDMDPKYKDGRGFVPKHPEGIRRERSGSQQVRSRSPSTSQRWEMKHRSPSRRTTRDYNDRDNHERGPKAGNSPGRRSHSSSRASSPERKKWHPPRSPERVYSKATDQEKAVSWKEGSRLEEMSDHKEGKLYISAEEELAKLEEEEPEEEGRVPWVRSAPADLYYQRNEENPLIMVASKKLHQLCEAFEEKLIKRAVKIREDKRKKCEDSEQNGKQLNVCRTGCNSTLKEKDDNESKIPKDNIVVQEKPACKKSDHLDPTDRTDQPEEDKREGDAKTTKDKGEAGTEGKICQKHLVQKKDQCDANSLVPIHKCKNKNKHKPKKLKKQSDGSDSSSASSDSDSSSSSENEESDLDRISEELERKRNHPDRLHSELWFNDPGEMNDGPLCRCSLKAQRSGIRHGYYVGEDHLDSCDPWSSNAHRLHHYLITISPPTNFLIKTPTVITHDNHEFIFEGFSLLSHHPLEEVPTCRVIRFNIEYTILYIQEKIPENFCIRELDLFYDYLFIELLELVDLNLHAMGDSAGCPRFHFMPRFVRKLPDNGKEILSMNEVLKFLLKNSGPLIQPEDLAQLLNMSQYQWQNYADQLKGMVVTCPGMKPCSIRVDQLDRDQVSDETINYPVIVHFGIRPPQLSYAGNPEYQKAWREYVKFRHLLANMPKPSFDDKRRLEGKENKLQEMRMTSKMKRDVTIAVSSQGFYRSGIMCDVVQHAMLLPVLVCHLRFHQSLKVLEQRIQYKFQARFLLQLALTHPSYRENFGTNPDHARNSLTNCGIRQPEYGDRRIHYMNTRKRGINTLINIMSRFGRNLETESKITHNERLEFLGDAVVEFLTSIHLFHLFPSLEEGGLATYRAAIVQNQHLAVLAEKLGLDQFMLYAHGSDLCHDFELRHAMANCFEALMGAIFLDSGIEEADKVLSSTLFKNESVLHSIWVNYPPHPIQEQEPHGDRKWIKSFPILTKLAKFEDSIGIEFQHIRLLARAFTDRSIGFNNLTLGSNQRLEFLGDTVLQLVSSEYLYRYFPEHHEGHLSLLRSSLVNNRTQAVVCDDLGMTSYAMYSHLKTELKTKDRADLLEAFLGALYIDRGLTYCRTFCQVCFFPRLHQFIMNQDWNDPKSKLQQCCLTLRTMDGGEPDIPIYKVIECKGPTNTRVYTVAVYFRGRRLAKASGHSIQQAEMNAAGEALLNSKELFPQLDHQRRVIEKSVKIQGVKCDSQSNDHEREKNREGVRNYRGIRREHEKNCRVKEREKYIDNRDPERGRIGEKRGVRERDNSDLERVRQVEKYRISSERNRNRLNMDRERLVNERDRLGGERLRNSEPRKNRGGEVEERHYRGDEGEERKNRGDESEQRKLSIGVEERRCRAETADEKKCSTELVSRAPLPNNRSQDYFKYSSRDAGEQQDRYRARYKEPTRGRCYDNPHGESSSKTGYYSRGDCNRKQARPDWRNNFP
ncbi:hypothetical protein Pmani_017774 [Petrolisthes manimaculis]|uniref:Ribonuclease 3 n=1 Tax=Petrolisthes manimaculis TaxID=1843537 RepID=A0AAE1PLR1_9EUCA|nr:hypothetical protein Pmani_017774 [Petrolisthes manimaculis]